MWGAELAVAGEPAVPFDARCVLAASAAPPLALAPAALAEDRPYAEGPIVGVTGVRTEPGRFENYMKPLSDHWIPAETYAEKKGWVLSYEALPADPRSPDDADLVLVVTLGNWAARDGWIARGGEVGDEFFHAASAADEAMAKRGSMGKVPGTARYRALSFR